MKLNTAWHLSMLNNEIEHLQSRINETRNLFDINPEVRQAICDAQQNVIKATRDMEHALRLNGQQVIT